MWTGYEHSTASHCCCLLILNYTQNQQTQDTQQSKARRTVRCSGKGGLMKCGFISICSLHPITSSQHQPTLHQSCVGQTDAKQLQVFMNLLCSEWGSVSLAQLSHQCKRRISLVSLVRCFPAVLPATPWGTHCPP